MRRIIVIGLLSMLLSSCSHTTVVRLLYGKPSKWAELKSEKVPEIVLEKYSEQFSTIKAEKWYKLGRSHYGVSFQRNGRLNLAVFSSSGNLQNEEFDFREDDYYEFDDWWDYDIYD